MTTSAKGKVKGEGRIISLNDKFGFLGAQGIKSKVFIIPSSLKADPPFPKLSDVLEVDDIVYFEAVEQPERNGAKYVAVDGSVKVKQRGKDVMYEGEGKIVQLDKNRGYFGFIEADIGNVFFNISAVRPSTNDVTKVLKVSDDFLIWERGKLEKFGVEVFDFDSGSGSSKVLGEGLVKAILEKCSS